MRVARLHRLRDEARLCLEIEMSRFTKIKMQTCFEGCQDLLNSRASSKEIIARCQELVDDAPGLVTITKWRAMVGKKGNQTSITGTTARRTYVRGEGLMREEMDLVNELKALSALMRPSSFLDEIDDDSLRAMGPRYLPELIRRGASA